MARVVRASFRDGSTTTIPVTPFFKLRRPRRGTLIELTLRDGSRALLNTDYAVLVAVVETLSEEDHGA